MAEQLTPAQQLAWIESNVTTELGNSASPVDNKLAELSEQIGTENEPEALMLMKMALEF